VALALAHVSRQRPILVGVSGGRDSMALLHLLRALGFGRLVVCHLDHGLRGRASRGDAAFVRRAAGRNAMESARAQTKAYAARTGRSIELAARDLRRTFFQECARRHRCRTLLLAHHADDQVETCLFNFLRGSGPAGLAGMRASAMRDGLRVLRPLLGVTRAEIDAYLAGHRISFREDATNAIPIPTRNRLRHLVIPAIQEAFGDRFRAAILRAAEIFRMEDDWVGSQVPKITKILDCAGLRALPDAVRHRAVLAWLRQSAIPEPGFVETRRVLSLLELQPAKVSLPGGFHARRRAGKIFLGREALRR